MQCQQFNDNRQPDNVKSVTLNVIMRAFHVQSCNHVTAKLNIHDLRITDAGSRISYALYLHTYHCLLSEPLFGTMAYIIILYVLYIRGFLSFYFLRVKYCADLCGDVGFESMYIHDCFNVIM